MKAVNTVLLCLVVGLLAALVFDVHRVAVALESNAARPATSARMTAAEEARAIIAANKRSDAILDQVSRSEQSAHQRTAPTR